MGTGISIVTHCIIDYKAILSYLYEQDLNHFTFYPRSDKPIKAVLLHIPINTY